MRDALGRFVKGNVPVNTFRGGRYEDSDGYDRLRVRDDRRGGLNYEAEEDVDALELGRGEAVHRMLDPDELARAMGFPRRYKFRGNKTERTRMVGNAVAVNTARALVRALMEVPA